VRHRNVCGIHEYGDDGPLRFITMEYISGVDLRKVLVESGGLPPAEAFDTCIHTAEGLQAIHDAGIVHRDLKTANLMRDSQGVVRLMDFGIAKEVNAQGGTATATGLVMGTPEYMSPEQARAKIDIVRTSMPGVVAFKSSLAAYLPRRDAARTIFTPGATPEGPVGKLPCRRCRSCVGARWDPAAVFDRRRVRPRHHPG
jgi:serine/threonine protein kinase